jgi:hypothetical protein
MPISIDGFDSDDGFDWQVVRMIERSGRFSISCDLNTRKQDHVGLRIESGSLVIQFACA